jgi:hypothetical protein
VIMVVELGGSDGEMPRSFETNHGS